jgi:head-tail adaptor
MYSADQTVARRVYRVTVRRPLDVGEKDRLVWLTGSNLILNVAAVDDSDAAHMTLTCIADAEVRGA